MARLDKTQVIMYHHTHWDREWWTTFQYIRFRLTRVVDRLLQILDKDPAFSCFTLDGQTIVIRDYLEVRPQNREKLIGYIRQGRIKVGPWHILPDEFLVSGESHIRNLWLGERTARQYGIRNSRVGYLPDQFGHTGQMPQILAGFGIDSAVVWRGFGAPPLGLDESEAARLDYPKPRNPAQFPPATQTEFWWEAPDGTRVLGVYLALDYYRGHFHEVPDDPDRNYDEIVGRSRRAVEYLKRYATTRFLLEPMGGDLLPADERLPRLLDWINRELAGESVEYKLGDLEEYVTSVRSENPDLHVVWPGEGRAFGRKAHLLPHVASSRLSLKRMNADCQTTLERYAEPYQALNWLLGGLYEHDYLWLAWEKLIQNHPHDSICGCSNDQVHREMVTRFDECRQIGDLLSSTAQEDLAARVDTGRLSPGAQPVVVFNPLNWPRTDTVRVMMNPFLKIDAQTWVLKDSGGQEVPFQARPSEMPLLRFERSDWFDLSGPPQPARNASVCTEVVFTASDVPGLGYKTYHLERREHPRRGLTYTVAGDVAREKGAAETSDLLIGPALLENRYLKVTVSTEDGSLTVQDKETGHLYPNLNSFRDGGDAGDTYNYSWPVGDQVLETHKVPPRLTWVETGPARATLRITWVWAVPAGLTPDRESRSAQYVPLELNSDVTLYPSVKRVDVRTHFDNNAKDHRLQALFPLGVRVQQSAAEGPFQVVERPTGVPAGERGSDEPAVPEVPQQTFASISDGAYGLTIANRGLPEVSVADDAAGTMALTVLRSVGFLSREDFLTRIGGAGPQMETPDAQMLGPVLAEYAIVPHAGTWDEARSYRAAHGYNAPLTGIATVRQNRPLRPEEPDFPRSLPAEGSLVSVTGDLLLTAVKRAEDQDWLVLRFLNESRADAIAVLKPVRRPRRAFLINLKEEPLPNGELTVGEDGAVTVTARPWQLVTIAFEF